MTGTSDRAPPRLEQSPNPIDVALADAIPWTVSCPVFEDSAEWSTDHGAVDVRFRG